MMYLGQEQRKCSTVSNVLQWLQRPVSCKLILERLGYSERSLISGLNDGAAISSSIDKNNYF